MAQLNEEEELPEGLIGILFDDPRGFVCTEHLEKGEDISDEHKCTAIFDYDQWFTGDMCKRGSHLVGGGKK